MTSIPGNLLDQVSFADLENEVKDYALCNGICMRTKNGYTDDVVEVAPVTVFPSPFPRECFALAKLVQKDVNQLMHKVAYDYDFLERTLESTIQVDEFTKNLFGVHKKVLKSGTAQPNCLGLFRADYMINQSQVNEPKLRQVEVNAIASSFVGLSCKVSKLHRHVVSKYCPKDYVERLPENKADANFAAAFIQAWEIYANPNAAILVVKEERTVNICDQRTLEFAVSTLRPDIKIIRRSFSQLSESAFLRDNQLLFIDQNTEVAVVYYRFGYDPSHYESDKQWDLRFLIEKSKAVKCPSINYHLSGVKKIQQVLSSRAVLEKFVSPKSALDNIRSTFAGMWGFEVNEEGDKTVEMALANPERFVMKPQREGGGNNVYGKDILKELLAIKDSKLREAYILMELIKPPVVKNMLIGSKMSIDPNYPFHEIVSELGIYGAIIGNRQEIILNEESGHVLRSKKLGVNEGGIAAGFGAIDSPILF